MIRFTNPTTRLTGRVVYADSPTYADDCTDFDKLYRSYPLVIVFAQRTEDVVNAIPDASVTIVPLAFYALAGGRPEGRIPRRDKGAAGDAAVGEAFLSAIRGATAGTARERLDD
jgi:hypothetical protein